MALRFGDLRVSRSTNRAPARFPNLPSIGGTVRRLVLAENPLNLFRFAGVHQRDHQKDVCFLRQ